MLRLNSKHAWFALVLACVTTCGCSAFAEDSIRVGKAGVEAFAFLPIDIGVKVGIFKSAGFDVAISTQDGGAKVQQSMAGGALDFGLASGPDMAAVSKGSPVKAVGVIMGPPDLLVPIARADGNVKSWDDMKGRSVAISQVNSLTGWLVRETSRKKGWGPGGITLTPVGDQRSRIAALETKQVDAMVVDAGTGLAFQKQGKGLLLDTFGHYVPKFVGNVIFASDDMISRHPDQVRRFLAAWYQTIQWMNNHRAETVQLSKDMMNVDTDVASRVYDLLMPDLSKDGRFNSDSLKILADSFVDLGMAKSRPDMSQLYTEEFLPKSDRASTP